MNKCRIVVAGLLLLALLGGCERRSAPPDPTPADAAPAAERPRMAGAQAPFSELDEERVVQEVMRRVSESGRLGDLEERLAQQVEERVAQQVEDRVATVVADAVAQALAEERAERAAASAESGEEQPAEELPPEEVASLEPEGAPAAGDVERAASATVWRVEVTGREPHRGPEEAAVTLVAFSAFDCALCRKQEELLWPLLEEYGERLRLVWKDLPLPGHKQGEQAALAGCAAHQQGRFWALHEALRSRPLPAERKAWSDLARTAGLDVARFERDAQGVECRTRLAENRRLAERVNAGATPSLFVNGRRVRGLPAEAALRDLIAEELAKAAALEVEGTAPNRVYVTLIEEGEVFQPLADEVREFSTPAASYGAADAPLELTLFGDFECPFSRTAYRTLQALERRYGGRLKFSFRHFPLDYHKHARDAALAALLALDEGRYWHLHDRLFGYPGTLDRAALRRLAQRSGLNMKRYDSDMGGDELPVALDAAVAEAEAAGVAATPALFINGRRYQSQNLSQDALVEVIDRLLKELD